MLNGSGWGCIMCFIILLIESLNFIPGYVNKMISIKLGWNIKLNDMNKNPVLVTS